MTMTKNELIKQNKELKKKINELQDETISRYRDGYDHGGEVGYERAIKDLKLHLVEHEIDWNNPGYGEESVAAGLLKYLMENHAEYKRIFEKIELDKIMNPDFEEPKNNLWYTGLCTRNINGDSKSI